MWIVIRAEKYEIFDLSKKKKKRKKKKEKELKKKEEMKLRSNLKVFLCLCFLTLKNLHVSKVVLSDAIRQSEHSYIRTI